MTEPFYRDPEALARALEEHGSDRAVGRAYGVNHTTIKAWRDKHGIPVHDSRPPVTLRVELEETTVSREEMLEQEVRELRRRAKQTRDMDVLDERLLDLVRETVSPLRPRYSAPKLDRSRGKTPHRFVLQWSDLHACEVVDREQMNGLNAFDWDVMLKRHERLATSLLSYKDNRPYAVEGLHVFALGDMLTGDIHDELRVTNEKVLTEGTFQLALDMAAWLEELVPEFPEIRVSCVFGNHGRRSKKPSFKSAYDNWDWLFYQTLALALRSYPSVTFEISKAAHLAVEVYDRRFLLWHGDGVQSNMPGVPWGGIQRRTKELSDTYARLGRPIDHFAVGHYHEPNSVFGGRILMNGSVKGQDEYSLARFGGGHPAMQYLHTFHPRRGLTDSSRLDLD